MTDLGYRAGALLARHLPPGMSGRIAEALADVYVATHPRTAHAVNRRLARCAGSAAPRAAASARHPAGEATPDARATYRAFARAVLDFLREPSPDPIDRVELDEEARRILDRARSEGEATLLLSGHFGPWEAALGWLSREVGPLDALAAPHRSRSIERFFALRRAKNGVGTLSEGRPAAAALARLRAGGWIAALADRGCRARRRMTGLRGFVPIDRAPLLLARRARARVLAGVSWRGDDGALHVRFLEPFSLAPTRGGLSLQQAASRLQRFFDDHVRAHPAQWYEWTAPACPEGRGEAGA
ncbi:MAG TPA: hypothetical protein VFS09_13165 [Candidatus Eisenbacteria bacterium]|nr:hypothetical protein [Candidatus Eisenbacteria bacterium]